MKIVVCVKQVPETTLVSVDPQSNTVLRDKVEATVNPFDLVALEMAIRLRDEHGGTVTALTMGPDRALEALKECVSIGADEIAHVADPLVAGSDAWATARVMARAIEKIGSVDLVLCGKQSIDGATGQTPSMMAETLDWPVIAYVRRIEGSSPESIRCESATDVGHDLLEAPLPAVVSVLRDIAVPRMPSLKGKMKAKRAKPTVFTAADLGFEPDEVGIDGSPTVVTRAFNPPPREGGERLEGEPEEMVEQLFRHLKEASLI